jgi:flagellin
MPVINTNVNALFAQNALKTNSRNLSSAMEQLSTGTRINSAKDDAAGLAITNIMTSNIRGLSQAVRNANDGINLAQTAEGAMIEQTNMLQRMRELAVQSSTATYSSAQQGYLDTEFQALNTQIDNIAKQTTWNGDAILQGNKGSDSKGNYSIIVGADNGAMGLASITVTIDDVGTNAATGLATAGSSIADSTKATTAITTIDTALSKINTARSKLGASINQLTYAADNLNNVVQNTTASRSQILDTDYATATTKLASSQIIAQAATAMLAQANQSQQSVLALLK